MSFDNYISENTLAIRVNAQLPLDDIYKKIRELLSNHNVSEGCYSLGVPDINEKYCFHLEDGFFITYYSERGGRQGVCIFFNYHDAVRYFIWNLLQDDLPDIDWKSIDLFKNT